MSRPIVNPHGRSPYARYGKTPYHYNFPTGNAYREWREKNLLTHLTELKQEAVNDDYFAQQERKVARSRAMERARKPKLV